ncbi:MAG: NTP transferase domain-containing protein [Pseudomonadota bacterium]
MRIVAILAGGLGTRLGPQTANCPKALVDVAGKPFVVRQLELLRKQGVDRVVLCIGHFGERIRECVGDGSKFGLEVVYSDDGSRLLGTAGALRQALPMLGPRFFVLYGDSYLCVDLAAVEAGFTVGSRPALMTVLRNDGLWDKSNVVFADGELLEYDKHHSHAKMRHIDYGLSLFSAEVFDACMPGEPIDLADLFHDLARQGQLTGYEVFQRFYEIGSLTGLHETIEYFNDGMKSELRKAIFE